MSDRNSTCPLDPMDTRKSNGQLEIHLTNGMSNGLLIFPSDILHRYWTLIYIWNEVSVSTCGGLIHGRLIFGGVGLIVGGLRYKTNVFRKMYAFNNTSILKTALYFESK
jgi:hypothetical protein